MSGFLRTLIAKHQGASASAGNEINRHSAITAATSAAIHFAQPRPKCRYESYAQDRNGYFGDRDNADETVIQTEGASYNPADFGLTELAHNSTLLNASAGDRARQRSSADIIDTSRSLQVTADQLVVELARRLGNAAAAGEDRHLNSIYGSVQLQGSNAEQAGLTALRSDRPFGDLHPAVQDIAGRSGQLNMTRQHADSNANSAHRWPTTDASGEGHVSPSRTDHDRLPSDGQFERTDNYSARSLETARIIKQLQASLSAQAKTSGNAENQSRDAVVNVTIGRVEVRATSAAHQHGSAQQSTPVALMTLGDYLNKRNRGGG